MGEEYIRTTAAIDLKGKGNQPVPLDTRKVR